MKTLSNSIFCDATFSVTCYHYKVVFITTVDGNRQHRPLMCSFIIRSDASMWCMILNMFKREVSSDEDSDEATLYVLTSDQEEAIRSGLEMSQMNACTLHFTCALHEKWNVAAHV